MKGKSSSSASSPSLSDVSPSIWPFLQDRRVQILIYALITGLHLLLIPSAFLQRLEYVFLDAFFRVRPQLAYSSEIVYVEIAQDSIQKIGRWPWPRHYHAALLGILNEWGARAVVFDAFFSEKSSDSFEDASFAEAIAKTKNVYAGTVIEEVIVPGSDQPNQHMWVHSIPEIEKNLRNVGHVNITPDMDGITRHVVPVMEKAGEKHLYLGMRVAEDMQLEDGIKPRTTYPVDDRGRMLVNWAGRWEKTYGHYSYWDVLQSYAALKKGEPADVKPEDIKGKIILIGLTAAGLTDIKGVPMQAVFPGVGVVANAMNSVLTGQFVREASWKENALVLCLLALGVGLWFMKSARVITWTAAVVFVVGWGIASYLIFWRAGIFFEVVNPLFLIFNFFLFSILTGFLRSQKEQSRLYQLATRDGLTGLYVVRHMRSLLAASFEHCRRHKREMSVVMTDVDFFKKVNDTYGHDAGDQILKDMARLIEIHLSEHNETGCFLRAGRYGGEEFIILIEGYSSAAAKFQFAEPLRKRVEAFPFHYQGKKIAVTLSQGMSELHPEDTSAEDIVKRADEALYKAKQSGRNRVETYESSK